MRAASLTGRWSVFVLCSWGWVVQRQLRALPYDELPTTTRHCAHFQLRLAALDERIFRPHVQGIQLSALLRLLQREWWKHRYVIEKLHRSRVAVAAKG